MKSSKVYSPKDLQLLAGCSRWELSYWQSLGFIKPTWPSLGQGQAAGYSEEEVFKAFCLKCFKEAGLELSLASHLAQLCWENKENQHCLLVQGGMASSLEEGEAISISREPILAFWPKVLWMEFQSYLRAEFWQRRLRQRRKA